MTHAKHTPGTWRVSSGNKVVSGGKIVSLPVDDDSMEYSEKLANATLISAAPDMLYALQRFVEKCSRWNHDDGELQRAKSAIRKATGA